MPDTTDQHDPARRSHNPEALLEEKLAEVPAFAFPDDVAAGS
ncbi:MAG: hypothetical protein WBP81_25560 [Solirubrobacteraceae bacterium]